MATIATITSVQNTTPRATIVLRSAERVRKIDTKAYLSNQSYGKMFAKTGTILGTTAIGAGIGAGVGSLEGGIGALPGAAIGGSVGLVAGIVIVSTWSSCEFKSWKKNQSSEVVASTLQALNGELNDPELICPITQEPPIEPVVTPYSKQVFEREKLVEWVTRTGEDPITHQKMTVNEIHHSPAAIGLLHNVCNNTVQKNGAELNPKQKEGLEIFRKDLDHNRRSYLKAEEKNLMKRVENKEMSIRDAGEAFQRLCQSLDPKI